MGLRCSNSYPSLLLRSRLSMAAMSDSPALMALTTKVHHHWLQKSPRRIKSESSHQVESNVQFEEFAVSEPCLRTSILTSEPILPSILNRFTAQAFRLGFQHIHGRCDLSIWFSVFWLLGNVDVGNVQMARNRGRDESCHQACCDVQSTSCVPRNRERICADLCN